MEFNLPTIITIGVLLIGQVVSIIISIRKPNEDQNILLAKIETLFGVEIKNLTKDLDLIKANHLPHIESDVKTISERLTRIETILEERLPHRNGRDS